MIAQTIKLVRQYESENIVGSRLITIAAVTNQNRLDERMALPIATAGGSVVAGLDIFFAFLGDKAGGPHSERDQEQGKDDNVNQAGIEKLRGVALDQPDD